MSAWLFDKLNKRMLDFISPLGKNTFSVEAFSAEEFISGSYLVAIDVLSDSNNIDLSTLLGKPATLVMQLENAKTRYWHGIVQKFTQASTIESNYRYRIELVPWLSLLHYTLDSRIFQNKSAPEIIESVFKARGFNHFRNALSKKYAPRIYCVQYHESDFDFVNRLMEQEGIFYYFEHSDSQHTLVLLDANSKTLPCFNQSTISYCGATNNHDQTAILSWQYSATVVPAKVTLADYNFEQPSTSLLVSSASVASQAKQTALDCFDYPGFYRQISDGEGYANLHMQRWETTQARIIGESGCYALTAGYTFTLAQHFRHEYNADYLLLSVYHEAVNNLPGKEEQAYYKNRFVCQPKAIPFRPLCKTPQPVIRGVQTAVVVGPQNQDIYTDKYGRVKIQFFWDRFGKKDDSSTCWVRVAQSLAGVNWGTIHIPRVGQEVIVSFIDGHPDAPLIIGSAYNAEKMPPYALPVNQTQTGIKILSSPNGTAENFSEFRFESKKGQEDVYFQAEKDCHRLVKNDDDVKIGHDQSTTIKNNRTTTLEEGNDNLAIQKGGLTITAQKSIELKVGDNGITVDSSGVTIQASAIKIKATGQVEIDGQSIDIKANTSATLKAATLDCKASAQAQINAATVNVSGDGLLILKGGLVKIN